MYDFLNNIKVKNSVNYFFCQKVPFCGHRALSKNGQNFAFCFLVCPIMTAMTGDKGEGGVQKDPPPCMNKVAEYFGKIRVKSYG